MNNKTVALSKTEQRVMDYMQKFGKITSLNAFVDLGETRLSAVIFNLKKKGIVVLDNWEAVQNRYGEKRMVKAYSLA